MSTRFHFSWLLVFAVSIYSAQVYAISEGQYFNADVPVRSQSELERKSAAELGLLDVLVRMSGSEAVRVNDEVLSRSTKAIRFVEQFQYAELSDENLLAQGYQFILQFTFSERFVKQTLSHSGQKFWSVNRPSVLVWLVEDSAEFGKQFLSEESSPELFRGLYEGANYRGLNLSFPLLDFQDQTALNPRQVWDLDEVAIAEASLRYSADAVLVGNVTLTSSGLRLSNWQYFHAQRSRVLDLRAESERNLGYQAVGQLADALAAKYALLPGEQDSGYYSLFIENVRSFADYRGLVKVFEQLDNVTEVRMDEVQYERIRLRLQSDGTLDQLLDILALNTSLNLVDDISSNTLPAWQRRPLGSMANPLRYRWSR